MTDLLDQRIRRLGADAPLLAVQPAAIQAAVRSARRRKARRAGLVLAAAVALGGSVSTAALPGLRGDDRLDSAASTPPEAPRQAPVQRPPRTTFETRWDDPTAGEGGVLTNEAELPPLAERAIGQAVSAPALGTSPRLIRVSGTPTNMGTVAVVYDFGTADGFPTDGRVRVLITAAGIDAAELDRMAAGIYPGMSYDRFSIGNGQALLMSANGIGRVLMLRDGLMYDLTGPALPPATARTLANKL